MLLYTTTVYTSYIYVMHNIYTPTYKAVTPIVDNITHYSKYTPTYNTITHYNTNIHRREENRTYRFTKLITILNS